MRGEDQQSGYEWSKLSLASTDKLVVRTGIKEVAGQSYTTPTDSAVESAGVVCCDLVVSRIDPGSSSRL